MSVEEDASQRVVRFNCVLCGQNCGMLATLAGDRIVKVKGDRDHPESRGYTCRKGRAIAEQHHTARRLDRPRLRGEEVAWEALLDDLSGSLQRLVDEGGPDRIAVYSGTGWVDAAGLFAVGGLAAGLGTRQIYSQSTVDAAPTFRAQELVTGVSFPANPLPAWLPDDPTPTLAVMIGFNPLVSGGYLYSHGSNWPQRLRAFRRRGGELWVIDPRVTKTARIADRHLAPRPGSDVFLLAWLVRELLEEGFDADELKAACEASDVERLRGAVAPFQLAHVAERTGLAGADLLDLLATIRRHRKVAIVPGTGASFQASGVVVYWLIWAAQILTGSLDREGGVLFFPNTRAALAPDAPPIEEHAPEDGAYAPGPASRPELTGLLGQLPTGALVDEIEAGEVRALLLLGGNPLSCAPRPDRLRAALEGLDVFAVADVFESRLTESATHVLPCTWITERDEFRCFPGIGMRRGYFSPALVPPDAERRYGWWVLAQLGRRLGIEVLPGIDPDTVDDESVVRHVAHALSDFAGDVIEAGPYGVDTPTRIGWYHEKILPGGRWRLAPRVLVERLAQVWEEDDGGLRLIAGRTITSVNAAHYAAEAPPPIHVSPDTARDYEIATGDQIRVSTSVGAVEGRAEVDDGLTSQTIWMNHGWLEQNVNAITDPTIDRLTGQPVFTGFSVRIERVGPTRSDDRHQGSRAEVPRHSRADAGGPASIPAAVADGDTPKV